MAVFFSPEKRRKEKNNDLIEFGSEKKNIFLTLIKSMVNYDEDIRNIQLSQKVGQNGIIQIIQL